METVVGSKVIGVIAAVLVFLGLVYLGLLVIPSLTVAMKILLMFLLSSLLTAGGVLLTLKQKNYFTTALLGCGCGSFFVSILLTNIYFNVINDIATFALLLAWMAISLALVKLANSLLVSIMVHVGMIISLCFAYFGGLSSSNLLIIVVYQVLSVVVITVGNTICHQKTYRFGLFSSLLLSCVAVIAMLFYYVSMLHTFTAGEEFILLGAFAIQIAGAAILTYLLFASTLRVEKRSTRIVLHVLNKLLLTAVLFIATWLFPIMFIREMFDISWMDFTALTYYTLLIATGIALIVALAHVFVSVFLHKNLLGKTRNDSTLEKISVVWMCAYAAVLLVLTYLLGGLLESEPVFWMSGPVGSEPVFRLSGLILVAIAFLVVNRLTARPLYSILALSFAGIDLFLMLTHGYAVLVEYSTLFAALAYMLLFAAISLHEWRRLDKELRIKTLTALKVCLLALLELSLISIFFTAGIDAVYGLLVLTVVFLGMFITRLDVRSGVPHGYWIFIRFHEITLVLLSSLTVMTTPVSSPDLWVPSLVLSIASLALLACALIRIKDSGDKGFRWMSCLLGMVFTALVLTSIQGLTDWFSEPYVLGITSMVSALICIIAGFITNMKPLRLYGLILVIVSVVKMVTLDMANAESLTRVIAFIAGGLICFGISALYSYTVKRFDDKGKEDHALGATNEAYSSRL